MLVQLAIRDIVLIDRLELDFGAGLTVLTGETGAGKSILLDAFSLALGGRGDGALVRVGAGPGPGDRGLRSAADHPARLDRRRTGDSPIEGDLILRRVQMADGRSRAYVNDQPVSIQGLRAIGRELVEIHGQHDDRALVDPALHRALATPSAAWSRWSNRPASAHAALRRAEKAAARRAAAVEAGAQGSRLPAPVHRGTVETAPANRARRSAWPPSARPCSRRKRLYGDLRDAQDSVAGEGSPLATLSARDAPAGPPPAAGAPP